MLYNNVHITFTLESWNYLCLFRCLFRLSRFFFFSFFCWISFSLNFLLFIWRLNWGKVSNLVSAFNLSYIFIQCILHIQNVSSKQKSFLICITDYSNGIDWLVSCEPVRSCSDQGRQTPHLLHLHDNTDSNTVFI